MNTTYMLACVLHPFSRVRLFATLWTEACQAPLSMGFSRQKYCGLPYPLPGDLLDPGVKSVSPMYPVLQEDSLPLNHWGSQFIFYYF